MAPVAADCILSLSLRRLGLAKKKLLPVFRVCLGHAGGVNESRAYFPRPQARNRP